MPQRAEANRTIPSAHFRLVFPTLEEPVDVTLRGAIIGTYTPTSSTLDQRMAPEAAPGTVGEPTSVDFIRPRGGR